MSRCTHSCLVADHVCMSRAWLWWLLLGLVVGGIIVKQYVVRSRMAKSGVGGGAPLEASCRYAVGAAGILPEGQMGRADAIADMLRNIEQTARGDRDHARLVPVIAELSGPEAAVERIDVLLAEGSDVMAELGILRRIYATKSGAAADAFERTRLHERLGWTGELATTFGQDDLDAERKQVLGVARRTIVIVGIMVLLVFVAFMVGLTLFVIACVKFKRGTLSWAYRPPPADPSDVVWLQGVVLLLVVLLGIEVVPALFDKPPPDEFRFAIWGVALLVFYPLVRGVGWRTWREDTGWHRGGGVFREIGAGIVGYLACLPIVALGFVATSFLAQYTNEQLSHPIFEAPHSGSHAAFVFSLYLAAAVWAPLVEETVFRGALYRYLRGRSSGWIAAPIIGVIFAAVHPQGFAAIPALAAIGASFVLLRQWRASLIAPMTAHALHNAVLVTLVVTLL